MKIKLLKPKIYILHLCGSKSIEYKRNEIFFCLDTKYYGLNQERKIEL